MKKDTEVKLAMAVMVVAGLALVTAERMVLAWQTGQPPPPTLSFGGIVDLLFVWVVCGFFAMVAGWWHGRRVDAVRVFETEGVRYKVQVHSGFVFPPFRRWRTKETYLIKIQAIFEMNNVVEQERLANGTRFCKDSSSKFCHTVRL